MKTDELVDFQICISVPLKFLSWLFGQVEKQRN